MKKKEKISRIVLTGGPCAGKTTALSMLMEKLQDYGMTPFLVPEVATWVFNNGFDIKKVIGNPKLLFEFERQMVLTQLDHEREMEAFAKIQPGKRKLLIQDRGVMDNKSYAGSTAFSRILKSIGLNETVVRDERYQAVFHLVTAADGAENFYSYNNPVRSETPEEARRIDKKTLNVWLGHEHLTIIGNTKLTKKGVRKVTLKEKMNVLLKAVCKNLGIPIPLEIERSFLLDINTGPQNLAVPFVDFDIRQIYLVSKNSSLQRRVRMRQPSDGSQALYTYAEKEKIRPGVRKEFERIITARGFSDLLSERDLSRREIIKNRYCFSWRHQYFQLDVFSHPIPIIRLEVELTEEQQEVALPPFLKVVKEITKDERYTNSSIAAGLCPGYS